MMSTIRRTAFTITELLVVISIIVLMMAIAVPAFSNLLKSSEESLAENQLKAAMAMGRDAAIQSETGDGATVFFFTPGGRISAIPCVSVGRLPVLDADQQPWDAPREVFVPVSNIQPLLLPKDWSVRGLAPAGTVYDPSGTVNGVMQRENWYRSYFGGTRENVSRRTDWVFPETGFVSTRAVDVNDVNDPSGGRRRTFMIRFKRGTGELDTSNRDSALVFDPLPSEEFRNAPPYSDYRADRLRIGAWIAPNVSTYVRRLLGNSTLNGSPALMLAVLGNRSPDTVLVRPVSEVALYQESHLIAGIGGRGPNRFTGTIYGGDPDTANDTGVPWKPCIDTEVLSTTTPVIADANELNNRISAWIQGVTDAANPQAVREPFDARIFTLSRYLGQSQEVKP